MRCALPVALALFAVAVGCSGGTRKPPPVIANHREAAAEEPYVSDEVPDGCEDTGIAAPDTIVIHGRIYGVRLVECTARTHADSPEQEREGFIQRDQVVQLVLTRDGERPKRRTILEWTDGWEWGSTISVLGILRSPKGDGALVLQRTDSSTGMSTQSVLVYVFDRDWTAAEDVGGSEIEATLGGDARSVEVSICKIPDPTPGLNCSDPSATHESVRLRFDGTTVTKEN